MLALLSVWIALGSLCLSLLMLAWRPAFTDLALLLVLYFGSPGSICLAGLVLWAHRRDGTADPGIVARRTQAKAAIVMALLAAAIVYGLVMASRTIELETSALNSIMPALRKTAPGEAACAWSSTARKSRSSRTRPSPPC